jgi:hypothetical protein
VNWLTNYYFGEGPGIPKDAPAPEGLRLLASVLGREWWELLKLNLLFVAAALPVVTLPAAYFATVSIAVALIDDRNVYLWRDFWGEFRARFVLVTLVGLVFLCAGGLTVLAIHTYAAAAKSNLLSVVPLSIALSVSCCCRFRGHLSWPSPRAPAGRSPASPRRRRSVCSRARFPASPRSWSWRCCGSPTSCSIRHRSFCRCWSISRSAHW